MVVCFCPCASLCYCCFHCCHHCCGEDPAKYDHWEGDERAERAVVMIQKHVRRFLVQRWIDRFYKNSRKMPSHWWRLTMASLLFFKVLLNIVCVLTGTDKVTQWDAAIPTTRNTDDVTLLQQHPHLFGWIYQLLVISHNITGTGLFIFGFVTFISKKGFKLHVWAGRLFLAFWLWHLIDGLVNATTVLLARGYHESNYPENGFTMWLYIQFAYIANCVIDQLLTGLAALQYKMRITRAARLTLLLCNLVTLIHGLFLIGVGLIVLLRTDITTDARDYAIVFVAEVPLYAVLSILNIAHLAKPDLQSRFHQWLAEHQRNMSFCLNLTLITGFANLTNRYAPHLTVVLWALQDIVAVYWVFSRNRRLRRRLGTATRRRYYRAKRNDELRRSRRDLGRAASPEMAAKLRAIVAVAAVDPDVDATELAIETAAARRTSDADVAAPALG